MPANPSPNSSRATCPPRDRRTTNTVPWLVTATHNHARLSPCRPPVSSWGAPSCALTHASTGPKARRAPPYPRPFVALPPAGLVEVGHLLRFNASAGFLYGWL